MRSWRSSRFLNGLNPPTRFGSLKIVEDGRYEDRIITHDPGGRTDTPGFG